MTSKSIDDNIKLAEDARDLFNKREFKECIQCLDKLNNTKITQSNKLIANYLIDKDANNYINNLDKHNQEYLNELNFNQQSINDYNKSLILSRQLNKFKESINILERRINLINDNDQLIDQNVLIKLNLLLITIYMERKENIKRALELLDYLNDRLKGENLPKKFYYLKVRCYLAKSDFVNFRKFMDKLTNNEQFMISCYLESLGGIDQSISKLSTFNSLNNVNLKNNEALAKYQNDKVVALYDLSKIFTQLTPEILYNFALMHLNTGNLDNALIIFKYLINDFKTNPRLWSRIADCYLAKFKPNKTSYLKCYLEEVTKFIGDNQQRKLILKPTILNLINENELKDARNYLMNSLILLKSKQTPSFYPSNELMTNELIKFKLSIFVKLMFINLNLSDFVNVNFFADLALNENPKGVLLILTILYKVEALVWLNRLDEAEILIKQLEKQLNQEQINDEYDDYINQNNRLGYIEWNKKYLKYIILHSIATLAALKNNLNDLQKYLTDATTEIKNLPDGLTYIVLLSIYKYVISNN